MSTYKAERQRERTLLLPREERLGTSRDKPTGRQLWTMEMQMKDLTGHQLLRKTSQAEEEEAES